MCQFFTNCASNCENGSVSHFLQARTRSFSSKSPLSDSNSSSGNSGMSCHFVSVTILCKGYSWLNSDIISYRGRSVSNICRIICPIGRIICSESHSVSRFFPCSLSWRCCCVSEEKPSSIYIVEIDSEIRYSSSECCLEVESYLFC